MDVPITEHVMSVEQLSDVYPLSRIYTNEPSKSQGLTKEEAAIKLHEEAYIRVSSSVCNLFGLLSSKYRQWQLFLAQFLNTFRLLLLFAALICLLIFSLEPTKHYPELAMACILFVVLFFLCVASYLQEKKTIEQIKSFQSIDSQMARVVRQGQELHILSSELVIGDLVWIQTGDWVSADIRLIYVDDLHLETSWISDELEAFKYTNETALKGTGIFEAQNIAFKGSTCTLGQGLGVVIRTGNKTVRSQKYTHASVWDEFSLVRRSYDYSSDTDAGTRSGFTLRINSIRN